MPEPVKTDVKPDEASSASQDVKQDVDSSATQEPSSQVDSTSKAVSDAITQSTSQVEEDVDKDKKADASDESADDSTQQQTEEDKGPIPYERFQEINSVKVELEQKLNDAKPYVEAHQALINHCQQNNITPEEYSQWMNIAALAKTDPQKALEILKPHLERLQSFTGEALPPDLQKAVDEGQISLDYAKRLVAAEAKSKFGLQQATQTQERFRVQKEQEFAQTLQQGFISWIDAKKQQDPDFKPKANADAPDGKFEFFMHKFASEGRALKANNVQDLANFADAVYKHVDKSFSAFKGKPNGSKIAVRSSQTNARSEQPKDVNDVIAATAAKHGITFRPS